MLDIGYGIKARGCRWSGRKRIQGTHGRVVKKRVLKSGEQFIYYVAGKLGMTSLGYAVYSRAIIAF